MRRLSAGTLHQGHQSLREERVGKAVPGLAHLQVGAEWRGRRTLGAAAQVERATMVLPPRFEMTVTPGRGVAVCDQCHCTLMVLLYWSHQPQGRA